MVEVGALLRRRELFATGEQRHRTIHAPRGRDSDAYRARLVSRAVYRRFLLSGLRLVHWGGDRDQC